MQPNSFCLSSYLEFRYVAKEGLGWAPSVVPPYPSSLNHVPRRVGTSDQIDASLRAELAPMAKRADVGLLLSGGMDSAILAAMVPAGTKAYTIRFKAKDAVDETAWASIYAKKNNLQMTVVDVEWKDYEDNIDSLMRRKRSPLHAVEVGLFKAAHLASSEGLRHLIVGNGADSTFGGLDKLLSKDWGYDDFMARYGFVHPSQALVHSVDVSEVYKPYHKKAGFDVQNFLKVVHGIGILQAFENAIGAGGCSMVAPYETLELEGELDLARIRKGESKYLIRELFAKLYPGLNPPDKIPFARPMDQWLAHWQGPLRSEFRGDLDWSKLNGDQKWLLFCLNRFLDLIERGL